MREVDPALIARRVRFVPYSSHSKIVCLRVELYGCVWTGKSDIARLFSGASASCYVAGVQKKYCLRHSDGHLLVRLPP